MDSHVAAKDPTGQRGKEGSFPATQAFAVSVVVEVPWEAGFCNCRHSFCGGALGIRVNGVGIALFSGQPLATWECCFLGFYSNAHSLISSQPVADR